MAHDCRLCRARHGDRYMCDPIRDLVAGVLAKGDSYNLPTVEFDSPVDTSPGQDDVLVEQVVIKGAVIPVSGVTWPVVVITGRGVDGKPLPQWLYPGEPDTLRRTAALFHDMTELAIRSATP